MYNSPLIFRFFYGVLLAAFYMFFFAVFFSHKFNLLPKHM